MATGNQLGAPATRRLEHACIIVNAAFNDTCYLVGSALTNPDYRDVDVRMVFADEKFESLFGKNGFSSHAPFWALVQVSVSTYLSQQIGLNVDFQIQKKSDLTQLDKAKHRSPLGILFGDDELPEWAKKRGSRDEVPKL